MVASIAIDKCWTKIGVWARAGATCPVLEDVGHCRNCRIYSKAGRDYLRQTSTVDATDISARTKAVAAPRAAKQQAGTAVIVFRLGAEWLALETRCVSQVLNQKAVRWIPHRSGPLIEGITNFDGNAVVVFSVRSLLGIDEAGNLTLQDERRVFPRLLVFGSDENRIAFPVDDVYGRQQYSEGALRPPPHTLGQAMVAYSRGLVEINGRQVGVLDGDLLLYGIEQALA